MIMIDEIMDELEYLDEYLSSTDGPLEYSPDQRMTVFDHIEKYFGKVAYVIPDDDASAVKADICVIEPDEERDYYTLVTTGLGAMIMNVPNQYAYGDYSRAELMICLPKWWKIESKQKKWNWPLHFLSAFTQMPLIENSWFAAEHIIPVHMPLAENTKLTGFMLLEPQQQPDEAESCVLPDRSRVNFYQLIPLYNEELDFEEEHGVDALLERMADVSHVVDIKRLNSCSALSPLM